jgi:hypothetical protein
MDVDLFAAKEDHQPGVSKVKKYHWTLKDKPGELVWLSKFLLHMDHQYQREASSDRVLAIAQAWSWIACGVIVVARRGVEMLLWVIDGQHRVLAAMKRDDIDQLPCLVFDTDSATEEARGFYDSNVNRRPLRSYDKWNALLMCKDEPALLVDGLIRQAGRAASSRSGANEVRCLQALRRAAQSKRETFIRIWPLVVEVCYGQTLHEWVFGGLMWLEERMPDGQSLTDPRWRSRVIKVGFNRLLAASVEASRFYQNGGPKVWASGMRNVLNKGLRKGYQLTAREEDEVCV